MSSHSDQTWPSHFPDHCPPADACQTHLAVYSLVTRNPPSSTDFLPHIMAYPDKAWSDPCQACGLSVFPSVVEIQAMKKRLPALRKYPLVARGIISPALLAQQFREVTSI